MENNTTAKSGMSTTKKVLIAVGVALGTIFVINSVLYTLKLEASGVDVFGDVVEPSAVTQDEYPNQYRGVAQLSWDNLPSSDRAAICEAHNIDARRAELGLFEMLARAGAPERLQNDFVQVMRASC